MKRISKLASGLLAASIAISSLLIPSTTVFAALGVEIDEYEFPDENFREYLKTLDTNGNDFLEALELYDITSIDCSGREIESLEGIKWFFNLESLHCENNKLKTLNLSEIDDLTYVDCSENELTSLIPNKNIKQIICYSNELTSLDVSNSPKIMNLIASENNLTSIDLSKATNLEYLTIGDNNLKSLDLRACTKLKRLYCQDNELTSLTFGKSEDLIEVQAHDNKLSSFDAWKFPSVGLLRLDNNNLTSIDLSNNPRLNECYLSNNDISFIEFKDNSEVNKIYLDNNLLKSIDFSEMENVTSININNCELESINVSKNTLLRELQCKDNNLSTLDLSNNKDIYVLICDNNKLTDIKFSESSALCILSCANNKLTYFNTINVPRLDRLRIDGNDIQTLDLSSSVFCNPQWHIIYSGTSIVSEDILVKQTDYTIIVSDDYLTYADYYGYSEEDMLNRVYMYDELGDPVFFVNALLMYDKSTTVKGTYVKLPSPEPTPTPKPTVTPTATPVPTKVPSKTPTAAPTTAPSSKPTAVPSVKPTVVPTKAPATTATPVPTTTAVPTNEPTVAPTAAPTTKPTVVPTVVPSVKPTSVPTTKPTETPVVTVTVAPDAKPTTAPSDKPTVAPDTKPTTKPSMEPTKAPATTTAPEAKPTTKPTVVPTAEPTKAPSVEDFAERLYTTCLGREAEEAGKDYWTSELKGGKTGAEVAEGFFFSPEYEGRNLNNEEFIGTLYETFMGRTPADDEVAYWSSEMENGKDRKFIFDGFVNSPEWANICLTYGIRSGGLASPTFEKEASDKVKAFAERLYTTCLGREAEKEGLEWWAAELANLRQPGTVAASGFFYSPEFLGLNTSDDEYVTRLYRTFMGREPEEAGFEFWTSELKSGKDRQYVFDGFSAAPEFADLCADAGIMR